MGCMTYIDVKTNVAVHSCQMCDDIPTKGDPIVIDGKPYVVVDVVHEITAGKKSLKICVR